MTDSRSRSRSPSRPKSRQKPTHSSGFRWKEKRPRDTEPQDGDQRLERGYRHNRDGYRESERYRERSDLDRDREPDNREKRPRPSDVDDGSGSRKKDRASKDSAAAAEPAVDDIARKFGSSATAASSYKVPSGASDPAPAASKPAKAPKAKVPTGPMIVVKVNDRLGTTSKIPCLPSDTVGDFKKLIAMQIGRKPHEIMLKRQSERPFKDFLTLEDYGVSDGVQLDLELDTGD